MNKIYVLIFFIAFFNICGLAQTAVLHPVKDNTMFSESGASSNGAGPQFFVGRTGPNAGFVKRRGLLQFDLSSIPAGSTIMSVKLSVTCYNVPPTSSPNLIELHKCLASWGEGTSNLAGAGAPATPGDATWTCRFANGSGGCTQSWTTAGGDFSATVSSSVTVNDFGAYNFLSSSTFIADVQSWVNTPASNFGWTLVGDEVTPYSARGFTSRNDDPNATTLTITYTAGACTNNTWTGAINSAWETPGNWSCGSVPDLNTDVIINSGNVILTSNRSCRSLSLQAAANFTVSPGFQLIVIH